MGGGVQPADCSDDELREAFLERYGDELSPEQLDTVSAGALILGLGIAAFLAVIRVSIGITS